MHLPLVDVQVHGVQGEHVAEPFADALHSEQRTAVPRVPEGSFGGLDVAHRAYLIGVTFFSTAVLPLRTSATTCSTCFATSASRLRSGVCRETPVSKPRG